MTPSSDNNEIRPGEPSSPAAAAIQPPEHESAGLPETPGTDGGPPLPITRERIIQAVAAIAFDNTNRPNERLAALNYLTDHLFADAAADNMARLERILSTLR